MFKTGKKNQGFDQNGGHHELRLEKSLKMHVFVVDFRATATHFVNMFVFLLMFEISGASSIVCVEYSASEVRVTSS